MDLSEENILSDENGNYAYLTFGGQLYTPSYLQAIDKSLCENCERCLDMCETRGLDENGSVIPELPEVCSGCGHCVNVCPSKSIDAKPMSIKEMIERFRRWKKSQSHVDSLILSLLEISSAGALLFSMFAIS